MIGDRRAQDGPPCDALAEAIVLDYVLLNPRRMDAVDLGPLLVFPEHRLMWQLMCRVRMRHPDLGVGDFYVAWLKELFTADPQRAKNVLDLLRSAHETEAYRAWEQSSNGRRQGFDYWLARVRRVAESRRIISQAQQIAERAWREDVDGARAVAAGMRPSREIGDAVLEV